MEDRIKQLELKITELENKLKGMGATGGAPSTLDPEELKTYQKVSAQLPQVCSTCSVCSVCHVCITCIVCRVCKVCNVCINECSCGPCIQYSPGNTFNDPGFDGFM